MIYSSEIRLRFIFRFLSKGRILAPSGLNRGGHISGKTRAHAVRSASGCSARSTASLMVIPTAEGHQIPSEPPSRACPTGKRRRQRRGIPLVSKSARLRAPKRHEVKGSQRQCCRG